MQGKQTITILACRNIGDEGKRNKEFCYESHYANNLDTLPCKPVYRYGERDALSYNAGFSSFYRIFYFADWGS